MTSRSGWRPGPGTPGSPYAALMRAYEREAAKIRRGDAGGVAEVIFRAATRPGPGCAGGLGPTSFTGGVLRRFVPDRLYEWHRALGISLAGDCCRGRRTIPGRILNGGGHRQAQPA